KAFAVATTKPTKCSSAVLRTVTVKVRQRVRVQRTHVVQGKRRTTSVWVTRLVPTQIVKAGPFSGPAPCYPADGRLLDVDRLFWNRYAGYANALLTLAHEAIHLGGTVGIQFGNGAVAGDPQAEAKAQCYGLQWLPYVAEQLGDTPDDAQALARYTWENLYP